MAIKYLIIYCLDIADGVDFRNKNPHKLVS